MNYVISSSGPSKVDERPHSREENPQSPSFVPSPFNCGPSPTGPSESRATVVMSLSKELKLLTFLQQYSFLESHFLMSPVSQLI